MRTDDGRIDFNLNGIWVFPKIMVPSNHPIFIGFSIIFTIHFAGKIPLFLVQHPNIKFAIQTPALWGLVFTKNRSISVCVSRFISPPFILHSLCQRVSLEKNVQLKAFWLIYSSTHMDVSKNRGGPPKCMVYNGTPYEQMDDLGVSHIFGNTHILISKRFELQLRIKRFLGT